MSKQYLSDDRIHDTLPDGFFFADLIQSEAFERTCSVNGARKVCLVRADAETVEHETNILQSQGPDEFPRGYYESVAVRNTARLALVLGPPKAWAGINRALITTAADDAGLSPDYDERLAWYKAQYEAGWKAARRGTDSAAWNSGMTNHAWDDGYLDGAAGRPKWHLAFCKDHDNCGEG